MNVARWFLEADRSVFYLINKKLSFTFLNEFMLLLRQAYTWIPLYLFILLFFYANSRKYILQIVVLSILTFAIADFTSASILKPFIQRLRPCHDASLPFELNNLAGCGGIFSMPSSHASNHFGLATFWFLVIKHILNRSWNWLWGWAFIIGYAQIYVGVHFPADILTGALLGIGTGCFTWYLFRKWTKFENRNIEQADKLA
ncbi:MAG: phosphoesterase PA-phosphatase related protein [Segetibacter sp.]|jgi:membrane-associated phospholipid phosphatase|nr:phosphoesterase PA-phosphatase related protein [Segetibacter sp.]